MAVDLVEIQFLRAPIKALSLVRHGSPSSPPMIT